MKLTDNEIQVLIDFNSNWAEYYLSCKQSNAEHAKSGYMDKPKEYWQEKALEFDEKRKYYRRRARELKKTLYLRRNE